MADQLRTTEAELYERLFPGRDPQRWPAEVLGCVLQAPVSNIPTAEDLAREEGQMGVPTREQSATQSGQNTLDYVAQFLGPLLAMLTTTTPAVKKPSGWTKPQSSAERLGRLLKERPSQIPDQPAYPGMRLPPIGGPSGRGKTLEEIIEYRAPLDMSDEAIKAVIERYRQQMRAEQAGVPPRPYRAREWPGEER